VNAIFDWVFAEIELKSQIKILDGFGGSHRQNTLKIGGFALKMEQNTSKIHTFTYFFQWFFTQGRHCEGESWIQVFAEMELKSQIAILDGFGVTKAKYAENGWFCPENGAKILLKSSLFITFSLIFELVFPHNALKLH
jgi:hypothetical protein